MNCYNKGGYIVSGSGGAIIAIAIEFIRTPMINKYYMYAFIISVFALLFIVTETLSQKNRIRVMHDVIASLMEREKLEKRLKKALKLLQTIIYYKFCGVYLFGGKEKYIYPFTYESLENGSKISIKMGRDSLLYSKLASGETQVLSGQRWKEMLFGMGIQLSRNEALFAIPIRKKKQSIGCILLIGKTRRKVNKTRTLNVLSEFIFMTLENEDKYAKLEQLASLDSMTNLWNHRSFKFHLKKHIGERKNFFIAIFDIDDFKNVNDSYGHLVGDSVLQTIAELIMKEVKPEDMVCRYGGEEFAIIFARNTFEEATQLCEYIRKRVECYAFSYKEKRFGITISCGVSFYKADIGLTEDMIFKVADDALYNSKRMGKNRVSHNYNEKAELA